MHLPVNLLLSLRKVFEAPLQWFRAFHQVHRCVGTSFSLYDFHCLVSMINLVQSCIKIPRGGGGEREEWRGAALNILGFENGKHPSGEGVFGGVIRCWRAPCIIG
jgi:hypothetical protein